MREDINRDYEANFGAGSHRFEDEKTPVSLLKRSRYCKVRISSQADYQFHGANRLGANSLLSCIYTGLMIVRDNKGLEKAVYAIEDIQKRFQDVKCVDTQDWANPVPSFINQLSCMIE
ncbi:MAG: hypothetical protein VX667_02510, partial [Nitrospinota bacterium]|nr:hypothetical protein [Nitrospinota bacterium]